jgi:hypothetical protein
MSKKILSINIQEIEPIDLLFDNNISNKQYKKYIIKNNLDKSLPTVFKSSTIDALSNENEGKFVIVSKEIFKNASVRTFTNEQSASANIEDIIKRVINVYEHLTFVTIYICKNPLKKSFPKTMYSLIRSTFKTAGNQIEFTVNNPILLEPILQSKGDMYDEYINLLNVIKKIADISEFKLQDTLSKYVYKVIIRYGYVKLNSYGDDIQPSMQYEFTGYKKPLKGTLKIINKETNRYMFKSNAIEKELVVTSGLFGLLSFYDVETKISGNVIPTNETIDNALKTHNLERSSNSTGVFYVPKYYDLSKYKSSDPYKSLRVFTNMKILYETLPLKYKPVTIPDPVTNINYMIRSILKNGNDFYIQNLQTDKVSGYEYFKYNIIGGIPDATKTKNADEYEVNKILFKLYTSTKKGKKCADTKKNISLYLSLILNPKTRKKLS